VKTPAGQGTVPVGALGQPELKRLVAETHRTVFDKLMIAQEADFRGRVHDIRFHGEDLIGVHVNPGPALQPDRGEAIADVVSKRGVRVVGVLMEMHNQSVAAAPGASSLALKFISGLYIWVKN